MNSNNLIGIYLFGWICAVLFVIGLPEVPYFLYFYIGSPVLVFGGMILYFRLGFDKESKERKRKHEEYLKEKPERDRKIELEKKRKEEEREELHREQRERDERQRKHDERQRESDAWRILNGLEILNEKNARKYEEEKRLKEIKIKEEKELLQTLTINKNTIDNSLINSFSYEQKLSIIAMMKMISHGSQDVHRSKLQQEIISKQESLFELSSVGCNMFLNNPNNVEIMEKVLIPLNNLQKDYIVGLALKVLLSGGTTNKRENMIAENVFKLFLNIKSDELLNRFQRAQTIGNYYTK